ncbi:hypothetical protein Zm00014a_019839 [Zea mays]|uniref:Uncharacterized protein n=1 Tax=Zea mays TaxID=4577 RepID=A0A317YJN3_MAIZE|nr:hypothetical protein Zm00014a_019839 [Zea mays]
MACHRFFFFLKHPWELCVISLRKKGTKCTAPHIKDTESTTALQNLYYLFFLL